MTEALAAQLNSLLRPVGLGLVEKRIGFWSVVDGKTTRRTSCYGYRLGSAADAALNGPNVTALDRFIVKSGLHDRL